MWRRSERGDVVAVFLGPHVAWESGIGRYEVKECTTGLNFMFDCLRARMW